LLLTDANVDQGAERTDAGQRQTDRTGRLDRDSKEGRNGPRQLKPGFERGERSTLVGLGSITLHDALEPEAAECSDEVDDRRKCDASHGSTDESQADTADSTDDQGRSEHRLFAHHPAHPRRNRIAGERCQTRGADGRTEPCGAVVKGP